jgi:hypothetical protein
VKAFLPSADLHLNSNEGLGVPSNRFFAPGAGRRNDPVRAGSGSTTMTFAECPQLASRGKIVSINEVYVVAGDHNRRRELRSGIAKLVETGGADPEFYSSLADQIEEQRSRPFDGASVGM